MPRIFDNIEETLLSALRNALPLADRGDFCVGYFNLRGWKQLDDQIEAWSGGDENCCRLLVGMQRLPADELRTHLSVVGHGHPLDNQTALRLKRRLAEEFREQLACGIPTDEDEAGLRRLAAQIKARKVVVKLFLGHPLHAKLYLLFRPDPINPMVGYLGSSNLTFSGLRHQGELNIDVMDHDACKKLAQWFEDRWNDRWCLDISKELVEIIETSWARVEPVSPYHIYLKIAYHLSQEARAGLTEFAIPRDFGTKLFEFQKAAVKIAAHHLNKRGGVLIGDVVGLGKTLMATAVARIMEDDHGLETLIICPKNLVPMWQDCRQQYRLRAHVVSVSQVTRELPKLRRYRLVLIDESHNLRNREGRRFRAIQEYVEENESKCILLSATPYNKTYLDLSNQLRLFVKEDKDLGIRPEQLLKELGETEFIRRHQCPVRSLAAFEKSFYADDWRDLMRLYLVRRTRSFIQQNYAQTDPANGRKFLTFEDGTRSYFPLRRPKTVKFKISDKNDEDQYARLYSPSVVDAINALSLPRYGLGNYLHASPHQPPTPIEQKVIQNLSRAGQRLKGFCRTGLFKRLESSGQAFMQSIERHILRNYVYLHAIGRNLPLPLGAQDIGILDSRIFDEDADSNIGDMELFTDENEASPEVETVLRTLRTEDDFKRRAAEVYEEYAQKYPKRFKWLRADLFVPSLEKDLLTDAESLLDVVHDAGEWNPDQDAKLSRLLDLLTKQHPAEKVLVFTQFADTVRYLEAQLRAKGLQQAAGVTGDSYDPAALAWRFSPHSNNKRDQVKPDDELRVLIATDVLSEGQNLQDCAIVVNFDLPWAIIRLIQRVGRVDRIGQKSGNIVCYSFLPADGVERIIRLRSRIRQRLHENAEVVGTDEAFFEDDRNDEVVLDLYNEKADILDGEADTEVDLASYAYQIWKNAIDREPALEKTVEGLPSVVYSTKQGTVPPSIEDRKLAFENASGVLVYMKTPEGNDALAWMDDHGKSVTESQYQILRMAECKPDAAALPRKPNHHELVRKAVELIVAEEKTVGGQLGRPSGARFRTYERLKRYAEEVKGTLFESPELVKAIEEIYRYPLRQAAVDTLNRQLRSGIADQDLASLVIALRQEERLCLIHEEDQVQEPRIICSMGLAK
ncbi:MAG TPA: NgoFVII family restriction endonuclease [Verrucomicrobia bacterium]|nr:MAG: NgoFVII family restriction endonuclease [Lentisphaerae bacterium GWF2_57_35]HBA84216.1 NgoFVII family restriction endonuclease [Verrucomicrobiota bacterium]